MCMDVWNRFSRWWTGANRDAAGLRTTSLPQVSIPTVMRTSPDNVPSYRACLNLISNSIKKMPLRVMRIEHVNGQEVSRVPAMDSPLWSLLMYQPCSYMSAEEWRSCMAVNLLTRGNAYALIRRSGGRVVSLDPIAPGMVTDVRKLDASGELLYYITGFDQPLPQSEIIHVHGPLSSRNAWRGEDAYESMLGLLSLAASTLDAAYAYLWGGGAAVLVIDSPQTLNAEQREILVASFKAQISKQGAGAQVLVNDTGTEVKRFDGLKPDDNQYIESRRATDAGICMVMGVPPALIGLETNLKYNTLQQQAEQFIAGRLADVAKDIEAGLESKLIPLDDRDGIAFEFDFSLLRRGDETSLVENLTKLAGVQSITVNEIRNQVGYPPLPGGDVLAIPAGAKRVDVVEEVEK